MHTTRLVKVQLGAFAVLSVTSLAYAGYYYSGIPRATGIGTYTVTANFVDSAGLYNNALVTYHGADIGVVESIELTDAGIAVEMQLDSDIPVPADVTVAIKSVSAIGEQYVDFEPRSTDGPFLHDGSSIAIEQTSIPTPAGDLVDNLNLLLRSVPPEALRVTLDESSAALADAGPAAGSLIDSVDPIVALARENLRQTTTLINEVEPVLDAVNESGNDLTNASRDLASFIAQLAGSDPNIRSVLDQGPRFADTVSNALGDLTGTLPTLLANLQTAGGVLRVNVPGLEQILVVYPAITASINYSVQNQGLQSTDDTMVAQFPLDVKLLDTFAPVACTEGYQGTQRRDPSDVSPAVANTDGHCTLPQADPRAVRGSRNIPCVSNPAVRTTWQADCPGGAPSTWPGMLSKPGDPLPVPLDVLPADESGASAPPQVDVAPAPAENVTPAGLRTPGTTAVPYDPATGRFIAPNGRTYAVASLVTAPPVKEAQKWEDLLTAPLSN